MNVTWKDDLRPMPDEVSPIYDKAVWDKSLIVERSGEVIGVNRNIFGTWILLVLCKDNKLREVKADDVEVVK